MQNLKARVAKFQEDNAEKEAAQKAKQQAKENAKAKAKKEAEERKAAEAEARQSDPKYIAKQERAAKKAAQQKIKDEAKEIKRQQQVDRYLTATFNRLSADEDITYEAIVKNKGTLSQSLGFNNFKEYFRTAGGLLNSYSGEIKEEDFERNTAFQNYKSALTAQGYDVEIEKTKKGDPFGKGFIQTFCGVGSIGLTTGALTISGGTILLPLTILPLFQASLYSRQFNANFSLKITEKEPILALEDKRSEQEKAAALLNTAPKVTPQPQKISIIK